MKTPIALLTAAVLLVASAPASAQTPAPTLIPFQGRLTDQNGTAYTNNQYTIVFQLYDQAVGGSVLWSERHEKVGVLNGMLNVFLGSISSLANVTFSQTRYLGITVDGDNNPNTPDPEMVPRQIIIPAFWAKNAEKLAGYDWSSLLVTGNNPVAGLLRGDKLAPGSLGIGALSPAARASLGSTIVQNGSVPGLTALETITTRDALAIIKDANGIPRIGRASAGSSDRSGFFGFALTSATAGQDVAAHQYGPLDGFTNLITGRNYYLSTNVGAITATYSVGFPAYVGHALSSSVLFADAFGASRSWGEGNFWGNGSDGAFVSTGTNYFASDLDRDVVVKQFTSMTINANDFVSVANRCRGLVIYVNGNATINGTLSMTARGAKADPTLPDSIAPTGIRLVRRKRGGTETMLGSDLGGSGAGGVGSFWRGLEALQPHISGNGTIYTIARQGGVGAGSGDNNGTGLVTGRAGGVAINGTGGGGGGSSTAGALVGSGSAGTCYSGGSGSGASRCAEVSGSGEPNGGAGGNGSCAGIETAGGAGNPAGTGTGAGIPAESGTGGLLILMVRGSLTVGSQGQIVSNGSRGGEWVVAGGCSGGGRVIVLHGGGASILGTVSAKGGEGRRSPQGYVGGAGGDGTVTIDNIDQ